MNEVMDAAAVKAMAELKENAKKWSASQLIDWWVRNGPQAGYRRLGRELYDFGKAKRVAA